MDTPQVFTRQFLDALARGLSDLVMEPLLGAGALEKSLAESIQPLHQRLLEALPSTERRLGLARLTSMPAVLAEAQIQDALSGIPGIGRREKGALANYLGAMVQVARQRSRRLDDPKGRKLPGSWTLEEPEDLLGLLPGRAILHRPGQRLASFGLLRFMGADASGETWKAGRAETQESATRQAKREQDSVDAGDDQPAPIVLRIILRESMLRQLRDRKSELRELANLDEITGLAPLRKVKFNERAALLAWEHLDGVPWKGGESLWELPDGTLDAPRLARWVRRAAEVLGKLHSLPQPRVHGGLCPNSLFFTRVRGKWRIRLTDLGWADLETERQIRQESRLDQRRLVAASRRHGLWRALYATPQRRRGAKPNPTDDIFALGVLWYQAVMGDWELPPPTGLEWINRAIDRGLTAAHGRILGKCLATDEPRRFPDGAELAVEMARLEPSQPGD